MDHQNRGNRGNRDPSHGFGTSPLGAIGEIETLSWFWKKADMCVDVLTLFGDWLVHASDVMVAMDENMYD